MTIVKNSFKPILKDSIKLMFCEKCKKILSEDRHVQLDNTGELIYSYQVGDKYYCGFHYAMQFKNENIEI